MNRRAFLQNTSMAGIGALIVPSSLFSFSSNTKKVRIGMIAVGTKRASALR